MFALSYMPVAHFWVSSQGTIAGGSKNLLQWLPEVSQKKFIQPSTFNDKLVKAFSFALSSA